LLTPFPAPWFDAKIIPDSLGLEKC
jgi:hypothetical protein